MNDAPRSDKLNEQPSNPTGSAVNDSRLSRGLHPLELIGVLVCGIVVYRQWDKPRPNRGLAGLWEDLAGLWNDSFDYPVMRMRCWASVLVLLAWTLAPLLMRPLTTPGLTKQQRYALCALILMAGLSWCMWLTHDFRIAHSALSPNWQVGGILAVGFLAWAAYLRLGWSKPSRHVQGE